LHPAALAGVRSVLLHWRIPHQRLYLRGLAQEVQLHINSHFIEEIHAIERTDWYRYGQSRTAMEKRLKMDKE
jgi:hypothetical protein